MSVILSCLFTRGQRVSSISRGGVRFVLSLTVVRVSSNSLWECNSSTILAFLSVHPFLASLRRALPSSFFAIPHSRMTWALPMSSWLRDWSCLSGMNFIIVFARLVSLVEYVFHEMFFLWLSLSVSSSSLLFAVLV